MLLLLSLLIDCSVRATETPWRAYDAAHPPTIGEPLPMQSGRVTGYLPHFSNARLSDGSLHPTHLLIAVHGGARNARGMIARMQAAIQQAGRATADYYIIAPQFLYSWNLSPAQRRKRYLYWDDSWSAGGRARNMPALNSIAVFDQLIVAARNRFPSIRDIAIVGHSAGGQLVHRLSLLGRLEERWPAMPIRYVVANPSSYVWLTSADHPSCPEAVRYKYGLAEVPEYLLQQRAIAGVVAQFVGKDVTYLLARGDDQRDAFLDTSCAADAQGTTRFARGTHYRAMLARRFGPSVFMQHQFVFLETAVGHDATAVFTSRRGSRALLGR